MFSVELLEQRTLLAGVTILSHGFNGDISGWVQGTASAIADRAGGKSAVAIYVLRVDTDSKNNLSVTSFAPVSGSPTIRNASSGQAIIELDWSTVSDGTYSTIDVGDVAASYLMKAHGSAVPNLAELPVHLIGHSRGASLNTEIAKDFGQRGIWVDQFTSLDPHPVNGGSNNFFGADFGDIAMNTWSNIVFADDYWRTNGDGNSIDPNGLPVAGAHTLDLKNTVQKNFIGSAHESVPAYYYGTIDFTGFSDGEIPVNTDWYSHTVTAPARTATGFIYSSIAGGARPADGLAVAHGGTAKRVDPGKSGLQYPNVGDLKLYEHSVNAGDSFKLRLTHQDRDGHAQVIVSLDADQNPFNNNVVRVSARRNYGKTLDVIAAKLSGGTTGVPSGTYFIQTETIDANGQIRFAYAPGSLTIKAASAARTRAASFSQSKDVVSLTTADLLHG